MLPIWQRRVKRVYSEIKRKPENRPEASPHAKQPCTRESFWTDFRFQVFSRLYVTALGYEVLIRANQFKNHKIIRSCSKSQHDQGNDKKQIPQDKQNATAILDALKNNEKINKKIQISQSKKRKLEKDW